jgi:hypothetical protein
MQGGHKWVGDPIWGPAGANGTAGVLEIGGVLNDPE